MCIGQTGNCLNKSKTSLMAILAGHVVVHLPDCGVFKSCVPDVSCITAGENPHNHRSREINEAFEVTTIGRPTCVNDICFIAR